MTFVLILFTAMALMFAVAFAPFWLPHLIARMLQSYATPQAVRLARSLSQDTGGWRFAENDRAEHHTIGSLSLGSSPRGVWLVLNFGNDRMLWHPNFIDRQRIWNAATAARARVIRTRLDEALPP
jgi:hypothetical protein